MGLLDKTERRRFLDAESAFGLTVDEAVERSTTRLAAMGFIPGEGPQPPFGLLNRVIMRVIYEAWCEEEGVEPQAGALDVPITEMALVRSELERTEE